MPSPPKERLDRLLVLRGLAETRARAQALIQAGLVTVDGRLSDKPGMDVPASAEIAVRPGPAFAGRGGLKLAHALTAFGVDPANQVCLDVGASTGGFTDALLQRGAKLVYAVDVGRGQLAWRLRQDPRVVSLERTDIRRLDALEPSPEIATVDVAFISLALVLPAVARQLLPTGQCIALVKPQFEAGRTQVGRGGLVRDPAVHEQVLREVIERAAAQGWHPIAGTASPVTGASGNREFFVLLAPPGSSRPAAPIDEVVAAALAGGGHGDSGLGTRPIGPGGPIAPD